VENVFACKKGDLSSTKIYFEKPIDAAAHWIKEGTRKTSLGSI
jgi:phosphoribosylformimino-5-aminoimidazole carboxamide ribonucleotide (ProFAR) isomerase